MSNDNGDTCRLEVDGSCQLPIGAGDTNDTMKMWMSHNANSLNTRCRLENERTHVCRSSKLNCVFFFAAAVQLESPGTSGATLSLFIGTTMSYMNVIIVSLITHNIHFFYYIYCGTHTDYRLPLKLVQTHYMTRTCNINCACVMIDSNLIIY